MSKFSELIEKLCPNGVEFKSLGEVANCYSGATPSTMRREYWENGTIPWMSSGEVNLGQVFSVEKKITQLGYDNCSTKMVPANTVVIALAGQGKTRGTVAITRIELCTNQSLCAIVTNKSLNSDFLYHYLKSKYSELRKISSGDGTRGGLNQTMLKKYVVPIPPIEVQNEIVRILDKFSMLEEELEIKLQNELEYRKQQYEYYRDKLLSFSNLEMGGVRNYKVNGLTMGEIGTFIRGKRFVRTDIVEQGVPCIHYGDMYTYYGLKTNEARTFLTDEKAKKMRFADNNDVIIVGVGENNIDIGVGLAWLGDEKVAVHDACFIFKSDLNPRYVSHFLRTTDYHKQIKKYVYEGKICSISAKNLGKTIIPVPSKEEQERIANILDRFEVLTTDICNGLPEEIKARQQQYEYYRNKLLTFKERTA
ncbi:MAG: restriction endonuclease subunit S [Prevotella sp.]|nr:restriction endonuclease subunit S [Prevotella sp.]